MKNLICALALISASAQAAPNCWTTDGAPTGNNTEGKYIRDGQFVVTVDTPSISKEDLLEAMVKLNFGNLKAPSYPVFLEGTVVFTTAASVAGAEEVDRPKLVQTVNAQIDEILAINGVKGADCNIIAMPSP